MKCKKEKIDKICDALCHGERLRSLTEKKGIRQMAIEHLKNPDTNGCLISLDDQVKCISLSEMEQLFKDEVGKSQIIDILGEYSMDDFLLYTKIEALYEAGLSRTLICNVLQGQNIKEAIEQLQGCCDGDEEHCC